MRFALLFFALQCSMFNVQCSMCHAQFNTDRLLMIGRSALYYEDYVLSIQYFNQAISSKPYLYEPWFFRGVAKFYLDDYVGAESDCTEALERNPYVVGSTNCADSAVSIRRISREPSATIMLPCVTILRVSTCGTTVHCAASSKKNTTRRWPSWIR